MRLWLSRTSEVSLRDQIVTQVTLAILTKELKPAERLPSTRELARRFGIHANTASAAYRELAQQGLLEFRHGSGVYVRKNRPALPQTPETTADQLLGEFVTKARKRGVPGNVIWDRMRQWLQIEPPSRWLLIEPDPELARIVIEEMEKSLRMPVTTCVPALCGDPANLRGTMPVSLPSKAAMVRDLLPAGTELTVLQVHPVAPELQTYLKKYLPEHASDLIAIASRWSEFQRIGKTMLLAAGLSPASLVVRDARLPGWKRGLKTTAGVVCDSVTERELPPGVFPMRFSLLDEESIAPLKAIEAMLDGSNSPAA